MWAFMSTKKSLDLFVYQSIYLNPSIYPYTSSHQCTLIICSTPQGTHPVLFQCLRTGGVQIQGVLHRGGGKGGAHAGHGETHGVHARPRGAAKTTLCLHPPRNILNKPRLIFL